MSPELRRILEELAAGRISVDEAARLITLFSIESIGSAVRFDLGRALRRGVPEIVFAEGKDPELLREIVERVVERSGRVIVSRLGDEHVGVLREVARRRGYSLRLSEVGRIASVSKAGQERSVEPCSVGVVTGGTADIRVAEEARFVAEELGCRVVALYDVGIAGLHRAVDAARKLKEEDVDVVIAVAGMEGALPSVIATLLDVPVVGVPTSVGYGAGGKGWAALLSMLQACPLGIAVVNIDGGVAAGVFAALIGRRVAAARRSRC